MFSGITVTVSLAALALTTVPFLRSIGLGAMLIPLISIGVSATLLPVILDTLGPRLEWPRRKPARTVSPLWTRIARGVVAHRAWSAAGALALLGVLIAPVVSINLGEPQATATAATAPADGPGWPGRPDQLGHRAGGAAPHRDPAARARPAVRAAARQSRSWHQPAGPAVACGLADAWSPADPSSSAGKAALTAIRSAAARVPGARVGGSPAQDADFITALYGRNLLVIIAAIVIVTPAPAGPGAAVARGCQSRPCC